MTFYHRKICHGSAITHLVLGNFLDENKEDIIVSTGRYLRLIKLDENNRQTQILISQDTYHIICSLGKFRVRGTSKDWIVFTTNNGRIFLFCINAEEMVFKSVLDFDFRARPLSYQSYVDSQKDSLIIASVDNRLATFLYDCSVEKYFHIYYSCDKQFVIYDITFVDIASEEPIIAYLANTFENLDAGARYEIRKRKTPTLFFKMLVGNKKKEISQIECMDHANSLISVPGIGGVLVCAEDYIALYSMDSSDIIRCSIPKRVLDPKNGVIFVCSTKCHENMHPILSDKSPNAESSAKINLKSIYYLAQTEQGDIFKIQLVIRDFEVIEIILKYYITLPVATALCTLESGYLFVASEFGNHRFYKIADIEARARGQQSFSSGQVLPEGVTFKFFHRTVDIAPFVEIKSFSPITQMAFKPIANNRKQMFLATGRGSRSALIRLTEPYKLSMRLEHRNSEAPVRMWAFENTKSTCKASRTLVVVSFQCSTAFYPLEKSLENSSMKEIYRTLIGADTNTIDCRRRGDDVIIQACPEGINRITQDKNQVVINPGEKDFKCCTMNKKSLIVVNSKQMLEHHPFDEFGFRQESRIPKRLLNGPVSCILLTDNDDDQLLAVSTLVTIPKTEGSKEKKVNQINLFTVTDSEIKVLHMLDIDHSPHSFLFMEDSHKQLYLLIGCKDGMVLTLSVKKPDEIVRQGIVGAAEIVESSSNSGLQIVKRERLGSKPVQLTHAFLEKKCILGVSSHSWSKESVHEDFRRMKYDLPPCFCILPESSPFPNKIATLVDRDFRILADVESETIPFDMCLDYTPKQWEFDSDMSNLFILESDCNSYTKKTWKRKRELFQERVSAIKSGQSNPPPRDNTPRSWASLFRVISLSGENPEELTNFRFQQNEAALSLCCLEEEDEKLVLVGVATDFKISTGCCEEASVHVYKIIGNAEEPKFLNKTVLKSVPRAMCYYKKYILIGTGRKLGLYYLDENSYELKLICERKDCVSNYITAIYPLADRILVSDSECGISCLIFSIDLESPDSINRDLSLHLIEKDIAPTELSTACILNECEGKIKGRMARATKRGDFFIVELGTLKDRDTSKDFNGDEPPKTLSKETILACFHVGEIISSIQKFNISPGKPDALVYSTLIGSLGIFLQLQSKKDVEFLKSLNSAMEGKIEEIDKQRYRMKLFDNIGLRARYYKWENVIDGDFLNEFLNLESKYQEIILEAMNLEGKENSVIFVSKRLETFRKARMLEFKFKV